MNKNFNILVCDDDEIICYLVKELLAEEGFNADVVYDGKDAISAIRQKNYDLLILDLNLKTTRGEEVLKFVKDYDKSIEVIILSAETELKLAVQCLKQGAFDFIQKQYYTEELIPTVNRALYQKNLIQKTELLEKELEKVSPAEIVGKSDSIKRLLTLAQKAALSDSNILIEGETGTGKELLAKFIHKNSNRKNYSYVTINCAALPDQLLESELFGYEKGAFTDAKTTKRGLVEISNRGTLFLDEIGELSLTIQPKLLRFLENGEYRRIGGIVNLKSDVRIICATNRNLMEEAEKKNFRRDLLFRLNVITLSIPPLRERKEDIPLLVEHFLNTKLKTRVKKTLSDEALDLLMKYDYPGNVRELEHIIERAIIFSDNNIIRANEIIIPQKIKDKIFDTDSRVVPENVNTLEDLEKWYIKKILYQNNLDRAKTANKLGISVKTLYNKIKAYNLLDEV
ncbi:MAG: sigma-54 dependent transcriptional regulator [Ignavibacterium sp.]|nr:sigma-54 dependent transcriptional regulator [Ignavibacterium sp.]MCX7612300.1 sigma-54 dependent transcriptional regulator [Ignavibacterium sp.]MDW8374509.1 sigma-54 dependent transcriptional regulator [Ignavibacteriales bacterium]